MEIDLTDSPSATSVSTPTESALHIHKRRRTDDEMAARRSDDPEGEDSEMPHPPKGLSDMPASNGGISASRTTIAMSEPPQWQKVIEKTVKAIVSIRFSQVSAFDTEGNDLLCFFYPSILYDAHQGRQH